MRHQKLYFVQCRAEVSSRAGAEIARDDANVIVQALETIDDHGSEGWFEVQVQITQLKHRETVEGVGQITDHDVVGPDLNIEEISSTSPVQTGSSQKALQNDVHPRGIFNVKERSSSVESLRGIMGLHVETPL
jgi:hypothetical protein